MQFWCKVKGMGMPKKPGNRARKRSSAHEKRELAASKVRQFIGQYARKAQKGVEPNDRRYDRKVEQVVKHMKPDALDRLLRDDE
jgi:hypothetical protein